MDRLKGAQALVVGAHFRAFCKIEYELKAKVFQKRPFFRMLIVNDLVCIEKGLIFKLYRSQQKEKAQWINLSKGF